MISDFLGPPNPGPLKYLFPSPRIVFANNFFINEVSLSVETQWYIHTSTDTHLEFSRSELSSHPMQFLYFFALRDLSVVLRETIQMWHGLMDGWKLLRLPYKYLKINW